LAKWIVGGILILLVVWLRPQLIHYLNESQVITKKISYATPQAALTSGEMAYHSDELRSQRSVCKDHSLGKLKAKPTSKIYTWKDEKGVVHFSDNKPSDFDSDELEFAGAQVFDYFSLNIAGQGVPFEFKEKLTRSINKMFSVYGQLIDKKNLKKVAVNLRFISSKRGFQRYKAIHAPNVKSTSGFYDNSTNEAVIFYSTSQSAMNTAIHESAHAINRGVIGDTNKWLNEGLAEYLETMTTNLSSAEIKPNSDWFRNGRLTKRPIPTSKLLNASYDDWNASSGTQLYATSWAFIYFLMDNTKRKANLAKLIKMEQLNRCDSLNKRSVLALLEVSEKSLQRQFYYWLNRADIFPHII
jgi:hypothetical protein